jgi:hypothetical protein
MKLNFRVKIDTSGMRKFRERIMRIARKEPASDAAITELDRIWMTRIRQFVADHFRIASAGGGDWPALAEATIQKRLRLVNAIREAHGMKRISQPNKRAGRGMMTPQKKAVSVASTLPILDVNGELRDAVSSLDDGSSIIQEAHPLLGYGGLVFSGGGQTTSGIAMDELAAIHQCGGDNLPEREIIPPLTDEVIDDMIDALQQTVIRIADETRK